MMRKVTTKMRLIAVILSLAMIFQNTCSVLATADVDVEMAAQASAAPEETAESPAPAPEPAVTEAPAPEPAVTEAPAQVVTEAPAQESEPAATEESAKTEETAASDESAQTPAEETAQPENADEAEADTSAEGENTVTEAEAPEAEETEEVLSPTPTPTEAPEKYQTRFTCTSSDGNATVVATTTEEAQIPENASLHADYMVPGSAAYESAIASIEAALGISNDETRELYGVLYDIYFLYEGNRIEPNDQVRVSISFARPVAQDIPEDASIVSSRVMHVDNNGSVSNVTTSVNANAEGAISSAGFSSSSFSPYAVLTETYEPEVEELQEENTEEVTRAKAGSTDLAGFLTSANLFIDGEPQGDTWNVKANQEYEVQLSFAENNDNRFDKDAESMSFRLPDGFQVPDSFSSSLDIVVNDDGIFTVENNQYTVSGNVITFKWNKSDSDWQHLKDATNAQFQMMVRGAFQSSAGDTITYGNITKTLVVDTNTDLDIEKQGNYDSKSNVINYTVTVRSSGVNKNVVVEDTISGIALNYNNDLKLNGNSILSEDNGNGFKYTIPQMMDNETATFTYSANVDLTKITDKGTAEQTGNTVTVKSDTTSEKNKVNDLENRITFTPVMIKNGIAEEGTGDTKKVTWTIIANDTLAGSMGGQTITDKIDDSSKSIMRYAGTGIKVVVTDESGNQVRTDNISWDSSGLTKTDSEWIYTVPASDTEYYKYTITYDTEVDVSRQTADTEVKNEVSSGSGSASGSATVEPGSSKIELVKTAEAVTEKTITWKITFEVPVSGLTKAVVTDNYPFRWNPYQDTLHNDGISVTGLLDGETYIPDTTDPKKAVITFYQNSEKTQEGLKANSAKRKIEITVITDNNEEWMDDMPAGTSNSTHINNASIDANGQVITAFAEADPVKTRIEKTSDSNVKFVTIDGKEYPVFKFTIKMYGVSSDNFFVEDVFDSRLEFLNIMSLTDSQVQAFGANKYWDQHLHNGYQNGERKEQAVTYNASRSGFEITEAMLPKNDGNYYTLYAFSYYLKVKSENLSDFMKASINGTEVSNTAKLGEASDSASVTYQYDALSKDILTGYNDLMDANKQDVKYQIVINPLGLDLDPNADDITLTDTFDNLAVDYTTIETVPADLPAKFSGNTITFTVPDSQKVVITYTARIVKSGKITNTAELLSYRKSSSNDANVNTAGSGTASIPSIRILKVDNDNNSIKLKDAQFQLFNKDGSEFKDKKGNKIIVTTGEDGVAVLRLNSTDNEMSLDYDKEYILREIKSPEQYKSNPTPYSFTISSEGESNYKQYIYVSGDVLTVKNEKIKGVLVLKKTFEGTGASSLTDAQKEAITFTVSDGDTYNRTISYKDFTDGFYRIEDLEAGTQYTVTETVPTLEGYKIEKKYQVESTETTDKATVVPTIDLENPKTVTITNTYTKLTKTVTLDVTKIIDGDSSAFDWNDVVSGWEFTLSEDTTDTVKAVLPSTTTVTVNKDTPNKKASFGTITNLEYDMTYNFTIQEIGSEAGVTNQSKAVKVKVAVGTDGTVTTTWKKEGENDSSAIEGTNISFTNTYAKPGSVILPLSIQKAVTGTGKPDEIPNIFTFTVDVPTGAPKPESTSVKNNGANVNFGNITFTEENETGYVYTIREEALSAQDKAAYPEYTVSDNAIYAKVVVEKNGENKLIPKVAYYTDSACTTPITTSQPTITNTYTKPSNGEAQFEVNKAVSGKDAPTTLTDKYFTFTLTALTAGAPMPTKESTTVTATNKGTKVSFGKITYDAPKEDGYIYQVTETQISSKAKGFKSLSSDVVYIKAVVTKSSDNKYVVDTKYYSDRDCKYELTVPEITNTYTKLIDIKVTKKWSDNDNQDNIRPDTITVNLMNGNSKVSSIVIQPDSNGKWEGTFTDLPKYDSTGKEIVYTVTEDTVPGYTATYDGTVANGFTINNNHKTETVDIKATKVWDDQNNQDGKRTDVTFRLMKSVNGGTVTEVSGQSKTIAKSATGSALTVIWSGLAKYENGSEINYSVREDKVADYTTSYGGTAEAGYTITNKYTPGTTSVTARKTWKNDYNNAMNTRKEVVLHLYKSVEGGTATLVSGLDKTIAADATGKDLLVSWDGLPAKENGKDIVYSVREDTVSNYTTTISGSADTIIEVVNTYNVVPGSLKLSKTVIAAGVLNTAEKNKEFSFNIYLKAGQNPISGTFAYEKTDSAGQKTTGNLTFDSTGKSEAFSLKHGETILINGIPTVSYSVVEADYSGDGYYLKQKVCDAAAIESGKTAEVSFTNSHEETGDLILKKEVSGNAADVTKEFTFVVTLEDKTINGTFGGIKFTNGISEDISVKAGEPKTITGIPDGAVYEVTEKNADGYTVSYDENAKGTISSDNTGDKAIITTVTNTRNLFGGLSVTKNVTGNSSDKTKPFNFTVRLISKDGDINGTYGEMEFTDNVANFALRDGETLSAYGLPNGISYTVEEQDYSEEGYAVSYTNSTGTISGKEDTAEKAIANKTVSDNNKAVVTNTKNTEGSLTIRKIVAGNAGEKGRDFNFTLTVEDTTVNGKHGDLDFENGIAVFTLKHGESKVADGLPNGVKFTVEEKEAGKDDYITNYKVNGVTGNSGNLDTTKANLVEVTNTKDSFGGLEILKKTAGNDPDKKTWFAVKITLDQPISGTFGDVSKHQAVTFVNGVSVKDAYWALVADPVNGNSKVPDQYVAITKNSPLILTGLPAGVKYTIVEDDYSGTYDEQLGEGTEGEIKAIVHSETEISSINAAEIEAAGNMATFTNTRNRTGKLLISKVLEGDAVDEGRAFDFNIEAKFADGTPLTGTYSDVAFTEGKAKVSVVGGETRYITGLPLNSTFIVTEEDYSEDGYLAPAYTLSYRETRKDQDGNSIRDDQGNNIKDLITEDGKNYGTILVDQKTVTVTNTRYKVTIKINKVDASNGTELEGAHIQLLDKDENIVDEWDTKKEAHEVSVEPNAEYILRETVAPDGYAFESDFTVKVNADGTITSERTDVLTEDADGNTVILVKDKVAKTPVFEKKIKDVNDTTGDASDWQDSADYDIGDAVPYRLTATLADNVTDYRQYHITFHDHMEESLTFLGIQQVLVNGSPVKNYDLSSTAQTFDLTLTWGNGTDKISADLNKAKVEVYFTATLNEKAVLGSKGNVNWAKLIYSSNPNVDENGVQSGETKETDEDFVIAFTYKVEISKVDEQKNALKGAAFQLEKVLANGSRETVALDQRASSDTTFAFKGLDDGKYILTETTTPPGYKAIDPIEFTVTADHEVLWTDSAKRNSVLTTLTGKTTSGELTLTADAAKATLTGDVKNEETSIKISKVDIADGEELPGAHIQILDKEGNVFEEWDSTEEAHEVTGLKTGEEYTLRETVAPDGYEVTTDTTFVLDKEGNIDKDKTTTKQNDEGVLLVEDSKTSIKISKVDIADGEELPGAHIQILDKEGNVVEEWDSTEEAHEVTGLKTEEEYTLRETVAPDGYEVTTDTTFVLEKEGNIDKEKTTTKQNDEGVLLVEDSKTSIKISKVDIADGEELPGAHIQILDKEGNVVEEWDSTEEAHEVTGLKTEEEYTLRETVAPDGYEVTTDTTFVLDKEGNIDKDKTTTKQNDEGVLLVEDSKTSVKISKVDIADGEELPGAHIQILDKEGNVVEEWDSTEEAHEVTGLKTEEEYTLRETVAPDGYAITTDTTFELNKDGTINTEKTTTTVSEEGVLLVEDDRLENCKGSISVTKRIALIDDDFDLVDLYTTSATYYVRLFSDSEGAHPYGDAKALQITNGSSGTATWTNLPDGTYYIFETTADGSIVPWDETVTDTERGSVEYYCTLEDGSSKSVEIDAAADEVEGAVNLVNAYFDIPGGFAYRGVIMIQKKVLKGTEAYDTDDVFYAGVFSSPDQETADTVNGNLLVVQLENNGDAVSLEVPVYEDGSAKTYYIYETDADGKKVNKSSFKYSVSGEGSVDLSIDKGFTGEVTITNTLIPVTGTPTPTPTTPTTTRAPKTGDNSNIGLYFILLAAALAAGLGAVVYKRRKKN